MVNCMVFLSSEIVQKKRKQEGKFCKHLGEKIQLVLLKKKPYKMHTFCHREEKTIEHNILGKGDRIQKIRFPLEGI